MTTTVRHGDCIEVMRGMEPDSVDSIVTDPPYGLGFMGKAWDALPPGEDWAEECLRVLKPGGYLLAFGGTRTWHRLAVAVEDAGFEIRDSIAWLYGSGFPKHRASLKPAFEPIVMARKPFKGSLTANEAIHGTGALNIDASRIPHSVEVDLSARQRQGVGEDNGWRMAKSLVGSDIAMYKPGGRWPANVILDESQAGALDEARFFYVAKAPKSERPIVDGVSHPTVKPLTLMRYLVNLVTPAGGVVLDPFAGSGTTLEAATLEGFRAVGIEAGAAYLPLIEQRLGRAA